MTRLAGTAGLLAGTSLLGIALNFVTQAYLAYRFGAGFEMDAYVVAITIPTLFIAVVVPSLSTVLIPVFIDSMMSRGSEATWRMVSTLLNVSVALLAAGVTLIFFLADDLTRWIAPGLDPATHALSIGLLHLLMPAAALSAVVAILMGLFQAQERFLSTAIAPLLGAGVLLGAAVILAPHLGMYGVALAALAGNLVQVLWLLPVIRGHYRPVFDLRDSRLRSLGTLLIPLVFGGFAYRATIIADRLVTSVLSKGSLSHLEYASRIAAVVSTLFASGIAAALYPRMSAQGAAGDLPRLRDTLVWGQRILMLFLFPALAVGWVLRTPLLELAFQRGQFTAADTSAVAAIVSWFLLGVIGGAMGMLQARVYYVLKDTVTPVWIGLIETAAYFAYLPPMTKSFGVVGVGMANSVYLLSALLVNGYVVFRKLKTTRVADLLYSAARIGLFSVLAGAAAWCVALLFRGSVIVLIAGSLAAALCYAGLLFLGRAREVYDLKILITDAEHQGA